jgi:sarcosine oxidase
MVAPHTGQSLVPWVIVAWGGAVSPSYDAEIAVVGVGSIGSMALWRIGERARDVIGFEQFAPGHDRGAAGGETRLFRIVYAEGADYVPLLRESLALWRGLEVKTSTTLLHQCGGLSIGRSEWPPYLASVFEAATSAAVPVSTLDHAEMNERFPQHRLTQDEVGVFDPQAAGYLRSDLTVLAATRAATDALLIETAGRTWRFRRAVVTAGSWARALLPPRLASIVQPRRILLSWFAARHPELFSPQRFPIFIREAGDLYIYGTPTVDTATLKVGGFMPPTAIADPHRFSRRHTPVEIERAYQTVHRLFHGLEPNPVRTDASPTSTPKTTLH